MKHPYILLCSVLGGIYLMPNILFHIEDYQREKGVSYVQKQQLLSMEVKNIYLVNQLHFLQYQGLNFIYDTQLQKQRQEKLAEEVEKMKEFGLVKEDVFLKFEAIQKREEYRIYTFNRTYSYEESYTTLANEMYVGNIAMEAKTNKIIEFYMISDEPLLAEEVFMKKYIQYLGLDVIDDWKMVSSVDENATMSYMMSEKAQLKVYTSTDRIIMDQSGGYQSMYRILFRIDVLNNLELQEMS